MSCYTIARYGHHCQGLTSRMSVSGLRIEHTMNNVVFIPGSPALIPELSPHDLPSRRLLDTAVELIAQLHQQQPRAIHVVSSQDKRWYTAHAGSFRAWGAPQVHLGQGNFLGELISRYILQAAGVPESDIVECRSEIGEIDANALTIVVLDGSAGLTARAPLALLETAAQADQWCQQVLRGQAEQVDAQKLVDAGVIEPQLWLDVAHHKPEKAELIDSDASLGVGRYIAAWKV